MNQQRKNNLQIYFDNRKLQLRSPYSGIITYAKQKESRYTNCFKSAQGLAEPKQYQYQSYEAKRQKSVFQAINEVMSICKQQFVSCQLIDNKQWAVKSIFADLVGRNKFNNMQIQSFIEDSQYFQEIVANNDPSTFCNYNQQSTQEARAINPQNQRTQAQKKKNLNVFKRQIKFPKIKKNIISSKVSQDQSSNKITYKNISFSTEHQLRFSILNTEENHYKSKDIFSTKLLIKNPGINQINVNIKNCIEKSKVNSILDLMARAASMHNLKLSLNEKVAKLAKANFKNSNNPHRKHLNNALRRQSFSEKKLQPTIISTDGRYNFVQQEAKYVQIPSQTDQMNMKKAKFYSIKKLFG